MKAFKYLVALTLAICSAAFGQVPGIFSSVNNVINPTAVYAGATLDAQINTAQASTACTGAYGCILSIPPGSYQLGSAGINITSPHVTLRGNGATIVGSSSTSSMVYMSGNNDTIEGFNFVLNHSTYGIIADTGTNQTIQNNSFGGPAGLYITASSSPSGMLISGNSFDGTTGCASQNNIGIALTAHAQIIGNRAVNTCGFNIETQTSNNITIKDNTIRQDVFQQSVVATSGQNTFVFTWPSTGPTINRVWVQLNGSPYTATSVTYSNATTTTVVTPDDMIAGYVVTAIGSTGLENIQANSQSFNEVIEGNTISGGGDAGIDVVSDYHMTQLGSATAAAPEQSVFTISDGGTSPTQAFALMNGHVLTPDQGTVTSAGNGNYTVTLTTPAPSGTVVYLENYVQTPCSTGCALDYPENITIKDNSVKLVASACIAPEIPATGIVIEGNTVADCGMGVPTPAYSSGIFTGSAQVVVKNNTIANTRSVPTMAAGISVQCFGCETGRIEKQQLISGNTYVGTFPQGKLFMPEATSRQSGIDVSEGSTISYPEQPNFDQPWDAPSPPNSHYFSYGCTGSGFSRNTTNVIGGVASATISSGYLCNITPTNQIFFFNSIMRVTFWAQNVSGIPAVELFSIYAGVPQSVNVSVTSTSWQQYSIDMPTQGLDTPPGLFLRIDGTNGVMNIQNITFAATPFATGATTGTGTSSSTTALLYGDTLKVGGGVTIASTSTICQTSGLNCPVTTAIDSYWTVASACSTTTGQPVKCSFTTTLPLTMPDANYQLFCTANVYSAVGGGNPDYSCSPEILGTLPTASGSTLNFDVVQTMQNGGGGGTANVYIHVHHN